MDKRTNYYIGIDPGTHTGVALWSVKEQSFMNVKTMKLHHAMNFVNTCINSFGINNVLVKFEDARKRKWFGHAGREQLQGAGSIKRDCTVWEEYLTDMKIKFEVVPPRNNLTKLTAEHFEKITGWTERTSEHARDAAMLVFKY